MMFLRPWGFESGGTFRNEEKRKGFGPCTICENLKKTVKS